MKYDNRTYSELYGTFIGHLAIADRAVKEKD